MTTSINTRHQTVTRFNLSTRLLQRIGLAACCVGLVAASASYVSSRGNTIDSSTPTGAAAPSALLDGAQFETLIDQTVADIRSADGISTSVDGSVAADRSALLDGPKFAELVDRTVAETLG